MTTSSSPKNGHISEVPLYLLSVLTSEKGFTTYKEVEELLLRLVWSSTFLVDDRVEVCGCVDA